MDDVRNLIGFQRLPAWVPDRDIWEPALARIHYLFREPMLASTLYESLSENLTSQQVEDVGAVVAFSLLHKFLLERYAERIAIENEPILFETVDCGFELIRFFSGQSPVQEAAVTICCMCKAVRGVLRTMDSEDRPPTWIPIEQAISQILPGTGFSHGFCESCAKTWRRREGTD